VDTIAKATAFQANTDSSNETQVRRILRDERLFLASVYYPFVQQLLKEMAPSELYLTEELGWDYVFWASADTQIETSRGWKALRALTLQARRGRFLQQVRIWKGTQRRTNVSCYNLPRKGHRPVIWYLVSSLRAAQQRLVEYACRWWHKCGWKSLKSTLFDWERGLHALGGHIVSSDEMIGIQAIE
jgi:hypothetical protein